MKAIALAASVFLIAGASAAAEKEQKRDGELVARITALGDAYRTGDVESLENLIAKNYSHINNGAPPIDRKTWLDFGRQRAAKFKDGSLKVTDYKLSDLRITLIGESAAVVTGLVHAAETVDGAPREYNVRFTNFWVKEDGLWKRAAFHDSPVRQ